MKFYNSIRMSTNYTDSSHGFYGSQKQSISTVLLGLIANLIL